MQPTLRVSLGLPGKYWIDEEYFLVLWFSVWGDAILVLNVYLHEGSGY